MERLLEYEEGKYSLCEYYPSNNDGGEKRIAIHLRNEKDKVFDGNGNIFTFDDGVFPIVLDGCENITLKNFSIDFKNPQHFEGDILLSNDQGFLCKPRKGYSMRVCGDAIEVSAGGEICVLKGIFGQIFNPATKAPYAKREAISVRFLKDGEAPKEGNREITYAVLEECKDGVFFRLEEKDVKKLNVPTDGRLIFKLYPRLVDAIFMLHCKNIFLENVNVYRSPAMGIIAQLSENITLKNVHIKIKDGREDLLSTIADATHFVNCYGKIEMQNCSFYNMMDDATNIHGIYGKVVEVKENTVKIQLMHSQQKGVLFVRAGDTVQFMSADDYKAKASLTAIKSELSSDKEYVLISFAETLNGVAVGDVVDNISAMPEVYISECLTGNNRPRGFLLTSEKKMEVSNCLFENSRSAIHVSSDAGKWYESGSVHELYIHDNHFKNCNYSTGTAAITVQSPCKVKGVYVHHNISIVNNMVEVENGGFIDFYGVKNSSIIGNKIKKRNAAKNLALIKIEDCQNIKIDKNVEILE